MAVAWIAACMTAVAPARVDAAAPVVGDGEIRFRLDAANFRSADGRGEMEFYLEIDNPDLVFEPKDGRQRGKVRVELELYEQRKRVERWRDELEVWVANEDVAQSRGRTQVLQLRLGVEAGVDSVHAKIADLNARKSGLFHVFTGTPRSGKAGLALRTRPFPPKELSLSDLEFARSIRRAEPGSSFYKSGLDVEPLAGRVFGSPQERVEAYYEVYDLRLPSDDGRRRYEIEYDIRDRSGQSVRIWTKKLASSSAAWADTVGFSAAELRASSYTLHVTVRDQGSSARGIIEGDFDVLWVTADWVTWIEQQDELTPFFLSSDQLQTYEALGVGDRQRYLDLFWAAYETEGSHRNPVREEFMRRVAHANARYTSPVMAGLHTDMGRVYMRFGEPDEVRREIIPIQGNDLNSALDEIDRESNAAALQGTRNITDRDDRAFEIWLYDTRGVELFGPNQNLSSGFGMKFIFVDDLGTDQNFRLIRSTERLDF